MVTVSDFLWSTMVKIEGGGESTHPTPLPFHVGQPDYKIYVLTASLMIEAKKVQKSASVVVIQSLLCSMVGVGRVRFRPPGKAAVNTSSKVPVCNQFGIFASFRSNL